MVDDDGPCFDRAVDLLSRRPHFAADLERKLGARGFSAAAIAQARARLERLGYLDEKATIASFVATRSRRSPSGLRKLRADLRARGADAVLVEDVLSERDSPERELETAREAAHAWCSRHPLDTRDPEAARQRLARHLERRGFATRVILAVLDACRAGEAAFGDAP
jgi:regulatory protein